MKKCIFLFLLVFLGGLAWYQRTPLLTWYYMRNLVRADAENRESWADRVATLDSPILVPLLDSLTDTTPRVCENLRLALERLAGRWSVDDERTLQLVQQTQSRFEAFSSPGRTAAMSVSVVVLRCPHGSAPPRLCQAAGKLLGTAATHADVRGTALDLGRALLEQGPQGPWLDACRTLALQSLGRPEPETRRKAVHLVLQIARSSEPALLGKLVPVLGDSVPAVRRAVVVAIGSSRETIADDDLLPLLHDPDAEVCRLTELALRSRGLQENHLLLARLISDPRPAERLQVLNKLGQITDLEPGIWLKRLSHDPSPAVRAATIRFASYQSNINMHDRLEQMERDDPSPTVRQLAQYYCRLMHFGSSQ
jgi:hypothetical protein